MSKRKRIAAFDVQEVSLVANPANKPSQVTLFKSEHVCQKADGAECPVCDGKGELPPPPEAGTYCRNCGQNELGAEDRFCRSCGIPFMKSEDKMPENTPAVVPVEKTETTPATEPTETPVVPAVEPEQKTEAPAAEVTPAVEPEQKTEEPAPAVEPVQKAEVVEIEKAEHIRLQKRVAELERKEKVNEAQARVVASMKSVPAKADELADKLVALAERDAELAEYVEGLLKKASALIEKGGLEQVASTSPETVEKTAEQKVADKVAELRKSNPKLTKEKAEALAWEQNPDLVRQYENEKAGR